MDVNDRIKLLMNEKNLSSTDFAEKTGIQQSTFSHFINGRNKASLDVVTKIYDAFPGISLEWILYGLGDMYHTPSSKKVDSLDLFNSSNEINFSDNKIANPKSELTLESLSALAPILTKHAETEVAKPQRKITEIRVFFDDNTYEIFHTGK